MNEILTDRVLVWWFVGLVMGLAVFPLGMLIREVLLAIRSARPISLDQARPLLRMVHPAPRPNVRKGTGVTGPAMYLTRYK